VLYISLEGAERKERIGNCLGNFLLFIF